ncbi:hypothetical protein C161_11028 [Paenibacillus sp. FSL R5-192]|uniref:hypothetical protein n=1 Tax=unclassified Paenibacillus TaxID=185978 RepID=UPI0003E257B9|nr:hypothetical protein [Paenibacillus sp. FSL R5-192]ETT37037.1 hypothetical protein C161_11028 [Paenibacillus sp. FSL R5-192]
MNIISQADFDRTSNVICPVSNAVSDGYVKIIASGELAANNADHKILLRINGAKSSYKSYYLMTGNDNEAAWDETGILIGRNGRHSDANFFFEVTLSVFSKSQKILSNGCANSINGNNSLLGFENHGAFITNQPLSSLEIVFTGGVSTGQFRVYQF